MYTVRFEKKLLQGSHNVLKFQDVLDFQILNLEFAKFS